MSLLHFRCKERRRTLRVALAVPLTIHGKTDSGEKFCAQTHSQSVNRHGALFHLEEIVLVGQTLILMNDTTSQSIECRVGLHPPGSRQQAVRRSGVRLTRNEFLAYAISDSRRKTAAPDRSQQGLGVKLGRHRCFPVSGSSLDSQFSFLAALRSD